jgi:hypothetical protein
LALDKRTDEVWKLSGNGTHVIEGVLQNKKMYSLSVDVNVKELVFVGDMTTLDGIKVFCEAVDIVASELARAGISVSFAGVPKTIDNVPSEEWIDIYAGNWQEFGLDWNLVKVSYLFR